MPALPLLLVHSLINLFDKRGLTVLGTRRGMRLAPSAELRVVLFLQVRVLVIQRKQMDGPVRARGRGSHRCVKKEAQPNPCPPRAHSLLVGGELNQRLCLCSPPSAWPIGGSPDIFIT